MGFQSFRSRTRLCSDLLVKWNRGGRGSSSSSGDICRIGIASGSARRYWMCISQRCVSFFRIMCAFAEGGKRISRKITSALSLEAACAKDSCEGSCGRVAFLTLSALMFLQLLRMYWRRYDCENPPVFDESTAQRHHKDNDPYELREKFYQYGIKPEWMQVRAYPFAY